MFGHYLDKLRINLLLSEHLFHVFRLQCLSIVNWLSEDLLCGVKEREEVRERGRRLPAHLPHSVKIRTMPQRQENKENTSHETRTDGHPNLPTRVVTYLVCLCDRATTCTLYVCVKSKITCHFNLDSFTICDQLHVIIHHHHHLYCAVL